MIGRGCVMHKLSRGRRGGGWHGKPPRTLLGRKEKWGKDTPELHDGGSGAAVRIKDGLQLQDGTEGPQQLIQPQLVHLGGQPLHHDGVRWGVVIARQTDLGHAHLRDKRLGMYAFRAAWVGVLGWGGHGTKRVEGGNFGLGGFRCASGGKLVK